MNEHFIAAAKVKGLAQILPKWSLSRPQIGRVEHPNLVRVVTRRPAVTRFRGRRQRTVVRHGRVVRALAALGTNLLEDPALVSGALTGSFDGHDGCSSSR